MGEEEQVTKLLDERNIDVLSTYHGIVSANRILVPLVQYACGSSRLFQKVTHHRLATKRS